MLRPGRKPNAAKAYLSTLGKVSQRAVRHRLCVVASIALGHQIKRPEVVAWHRFTWEDAARVRAGLVAPRVKGGPPRYALQTANAMITAWRQVMRTCWLLGLLTRDEAERAAAITRVQGSAAPSRHYIATRDRDRLLSMVAADWTTIGARDAAILALGFFGGLRRGEIVSLRVSDVDLARDEVRVFGKGGRWRTVFMGPGLAHVERWLDVRRGGSGDPLFVAARHGRLQRKVRCTDGMVYQMVLRRGKAAGFGELRPHDLRRACATHLLESGTDVLEVQRYLGHAKTETTAMYDLRSLASMRSAHARAFGR